MEKQGNHFKRLFRVCFLAFTGLLCVVLICAVVYRHRFTPLDYQVNSGYPLVAWQEYLSAQGGDSKLWNNSGFLGAYPYHASGTVIYKLSYPFALDTVRISDQHTQWHEDDRVKLWASADGQSWILCYENGEQSQVVAYSVTSRKSFQGKREVWLKYELSAGDPNRAPDDNRGASLRGFRVQAVLQQAFLPILWKVVRYLLLPACAVLSLVFFLLSVTPDIRQWEILFIALLMLGAFAFRVGFSRTVNHPPAFGDAYYYNLQAIDLLAWVTHPGQYLAQGNFWGPLKGLYVKGAVHLLYVSAMYLIAGVENYAILRIAQGLLDTCTCLLIYFIGRALGHRLTGILAGVGYAVYVPFLVAADAILWQESLSIFWLTLTVWLFLKTTAERSAAYGLCAGACLGITVLCRVALNFLILPMLAAAFWVMFQQRRLRPFFWRRSLSLLAGLTLVLLPWLCLAVLFFQASKLSTAQSQYFHFYRALINNGWLTCQTHLVQGDRLLALLTERNHAEPTMTDFRDAYVNTVKAAPFTFLLTSIHKWYYYWQHPFNNFDQTFLIPLRDQSRYHQMVVLAALWGLMFALPIWRQSLFVMLPVGYFALIALVSVIEVRHALPAFPFIIVMSAYAVAFLIHHLRGLMERAPHPLPPLRKRRGIGILFPSPSGWGRGWGGLAGLALLAGLLYLLSRSMTAPHLLAAFPRVSAPTAHALALASVNAFLAALGVLTYALVRHPTSPPQSPSPKRRGGGWKQSPLPPSPSERGQGVRWGILTACFPVCMIALVANLHGVLAEDWREWKVRLDDRQLKIRQQIVLPAKLPEFAEAYLKFDLRGGPGHNYDLAITVNGQEIKRYQHGVAPDAETSAYLQAAYGGSFRLYLDFQRKTARDLRQWFTVPLDRPVLLRTSTLVIEAQLEGGGGPHYVDLYGDYPAANQDSPPRLPAFGLGTNRTSLYKYLLDDEYRLWALSEVKDNTQLPSQIGVTMAVSKDTDADLTRWQQYLPPVTMSSRFFDGNRWREDDLSPERGRQAGQYRIRLLLKDKAGNYLVL